MARTKVDKDANTTVKTVRRTTEIIEITKTKKEICITRRRQGSIM